MDILPYQLPRKIQENILYKMQENIKKENIMKQNIRKIYYTELYNRFLINKINKYPFKISKYFYII